MNGRLDAICRTFRNARSVAITSPATREYNCIAWAMGDASRWWWPIGFGDPYWPPGVMRELSRRSFEYAFVACGYAPCADGVLVPGVEKVCLYEKEAMPTHAARQLPTGRWTSKLGPDEDVEHDIADLAGRRFGRAAAWYERAVREVISRDADSASIG